MKKILYYWFLPLWLAIPYRTFSQEMYTLTGQITGTENESIYLYQGIEEVLLDSTVADGGRFSFNRTLAEPNMHSITVEGTQGRVSFIWDENITVQASKDSLSGAHITGSSATNLWIYKQQQHYDPLQDSLIKMTPHLQEAMAANDSVALARITAQQKKLLDADQKKSINLVKEYPESFVSLYLLNHHSEDIGPDSTALILAKLASYWADHSLYQQLNKWAANKRSVLEGNIAPHFTATTTKGEQISLEAFKGKYVVIDFWGTWCAPCIKNIPELKEFYQNNVDKEVILISVACETGKDETAMLSKVKKFVSKREMNWLHILEDRAGADQETSLIHKYAIDSYPTIVAIGPDGKVLFYGEGMNEVPEVLTAVQKKIQ